MEMENMSEHRMRLDDSELTFLINSLKELAKSHKEVLAMLPKINEDEKQSDLICFYNRKIAALTGMTRRLESVRENGKRQLRVFERMALIAVINQEADAANNG
jgi:hypothetical protein